MAIHKIIEITSQSNKSWEDAAQKAVKDAGKTVKNIKSIYIQDIEGRVKGSKIVDFRVKAKLTFEVSG